MPFWHLPSLQEHPGVAVQIHDQLKVKKTQVVQITGWDVGGWKQQILGKDDTDGIKQDHDQQRQHEMYDDDGTFVAQALRIMSNLVWCCAELLF